MREASQREPEEKTESRNFISSGSAMLNLACTDTVRGAFIPGTVVNVVGDSQSGKTALGLTTFAETAMNPEMDVYRLLYDEPEVALEFDINKMFGPKVADRMEHISSDTVLSFRGNVMDAVENGRPFIYILDSLDALTTDEELEKAEQAVQAKRKGTKVAGSFGMNKAKGMSEFFRGMIRAIKATQSLLVIISQTRDNINPMSFAPKTRSGGRALQFYCSHVMWLAHAGKRTADASGRKQTIGADVKVKVTKNKLTGKVREVEFPIFYDYGVDDIGSCVDFLERAKALDSFKTKYKIQGKLVKKVINQIEDNNLEHKLHRAVGLKWREIEDSLKLGRKPKYS